MILLLGDFGVSLLIEEGDDSINKWAGTYHFMCPEPMKSNNANGKAEKGGYSGKKADIWALGVTLFALTFTVLPFDGKSIAEIRNNIQNAKYSLVKK